MPFHHTHRRTWLATAVAALATLSLGNAQAQTYPAAGKPIKIVVGFAAGGFTDVLARTLAQRLQTALGTTVIVENKPGATGTIGADMVAKSPADGYTLLMGHFASNSVAPALFPKLPYDVFKDFTPIVRVASTPMVLVVHPSVAATDVKSFTELAKRQPDQLSFASSGNGTAQHLAAAQFMHVTQTRMVHVPYKGSGPAMSDLLGGQVNLNFDSPPNVLPHLKAGKLRAIAVTSLKRISVMPNVPTFNEAGLPNFEMLQWFGVFAPKALPAPILQRLNTELNTILKSSEVTEQIAAQGGEVIGGSADDFSAFLKRDVAKWDALVKSAGIKLD